MGSNGEEIRRTVLLTEQDVVAANRLFARRIRQSRVAWALPVLAGLVTAAIYLERDRRLVGIPYAAGAGLVTAISTYLFVWLYQVAAIPTWARRNYRETPGMRKPADYALTPDTLSYVQEDCSAQMAWHTLVRWNADQNCLILFNTRVTFYILPRRDLSDENVARIEGWLTQAGVPRS
jgi:hypothetical protein